MKFTRASANKQGASCKNILFRIRDSICCLLNLYSDVHLLCVNDIINVSLIEPHCRSTRVHKQKCLHMTRDRDPFAHHHTKFRLSCCSNQYYLHVWWFTLHFSINILTAVMHTIFCLMVLFRFTKILCIPRIIFIWANLHFQQLKHYKWMAFPMWIKWI